MATWRYALFMPRWRLMMQGAFFNDLLRLRILGWPEPTVWSGGRAAAY